MISFEWVMLDKRCFWEDDNSRKVALSGDKSKYGAIPCIKVYTSFWMSPGTGRTSTAKT
jgi:hypothetical protein